MLRNCGRIMPSLSYRDPPSPTLWASPSTRLRGRAHVPASPPPQEHCPDIDSPPNPGKPPPTLLPFSLSLPRKPPRTPSRPLGLRGVQQQCMPVRRGAECMHSGALWYCPNGLLLLGGSQFNLCRPLLMRSAAESHLFSSSHITRSRDKSANQPWPPRPPSSNTFTAPLALAPQQRHRSSHQFHVSTQGNKRRRRAPCMHADVRVVPTRHRHYN